MSGYNTCSSFSNLHSVQIDVKRQFAVPFSLSKPKQCMGTCLLLILWSMMKNRIGASMVTFPCSFCSRLAHATGDPFDLKRRFCVGRLERGAFRVAVAL